MHDHLEKSDSGDTDIFEIVGVGLPGPFAGDGFLFCFIIAIEGVSVWVYEFDGIFELCLRSDDADL